MGCALQVIMNTETKATKAHTLRTRDGKYKARRCGACGSANTEMHAEGADKWCECSDCGHSTDLGGR